LYGSRLHEMRRGEEGFDPYVGCPPCLVREGSMTLHGVPHGLDYGFQSPHPPSPFPSPRMLPLGLIHEDMFWNLDHEVRKHLCSVSSTPPILPSHHAVEIFFGKKFCLSFDGGGMTLEIPPPAGLSFVTPAHFLSHLSVVPCLFRPSEDQTLPCNAVIQRLPL